MISQILAKSYNLNQELKRIQHLCPKQYYSLNRCYKKNQDHKKVHVEKSEYPCLYFYRGTCKYGFKCHHQHLIKRKIIQNEPKPQTCKHLYFDNYCKLGTKCLYSHDLSDYACVHYWAGKCIHGKLCRFSHDEDKKISIPLVCFFQLMGECNYPDQCECDHKLSLDQKLKYITYEGN